MPSLHKAAFVRQPLRNLNYPNAAGSPLRKSLLIASTPLIKASRNNDEEERLQRRSSINLQRRISNVTGANKSSTSEHAELSESKMQDHFQTCLRMFTENKINTKNAWNLQIIEFMKKLVDKEFSSGESIQLASTSLDISSKVYSLRVDDIHHDILQLATTMGRINLEAENLDEDAPEDDNESTHGEEAETRRNKKREKRPKKRFSFSDDNNAATLAAKPESLEGNISVHNTEYKLGISNKQRLYMLSAMRTQRFGYELLVRDRSNVPYWSPAEETPDVRPASGLISVNIPAETGTLCPSFADFVVDQWEPDSEILLNRSREHMDEVVYDENGFPIPEIDQSLCAADNHMDDNHLSDVEEEFEAAAHAGLRAEVAHITDMRPGSSIVSSVVNGLEYSYRTPPVISERYLLTGVWAGPAHWKVKCLQPEKNNGAEVKVAQQAKGTRKRLPKNTDIDIYMSNADFDQYIIAGRKANLMKPFLMNDNEKLILPPDLSVTSRNCASLFLRPEMLISQQAKPTGTGDSHVDLNITNYQYDNPNDAEYCNQTLTGEPADGGDDDIDAPDADDSCMDENMVNMPHIVAKTHVPYATQAKKMDMKKLKEAMLRTLVQQDPANVDASASATEALLNSPRLSQVSFCKMYEELPNQLNNRMTDELSCPLAFVALLHLCNEKNLELKGQADLLDVLINAT